MILNKYKVARAKQETHRRDLLWREDLQGLRALALFLIIAGHAGAPFIGFVVAIDIFLVISGFALTLLMLRVVEKYGSVYLIPYFVARIKRLIPALLVMLTFVVLVLVFILPLGTGDTRQTIEVANGSVLFIANIVVDNSLGGYFAEDLFTKQNPLVHMWGLSVEEQIFILFPFLILLSFLIARKDFVFFKQRMIILFLILAIASFSLIYLVANGLHLPFMSDDPKSSIYLSALTRFWEFAAGAITAVLLYRKYSVKRPVLWGIIGSLLIIGVAFILKPADIYPSFLTLFVVLGTCLIIYAGSSSREASTANPLTFRPLTFVGDISYPWFLWHMPFIVFAFAIFERNFWIGLLAGLLAGIPAFISDRFIEKPLFYSKFLSIKRTLILFPVAIASFLVFTSVILNDTIINKIQPWGWANHEVVKNNCHLPEADPADCTWRVPGSDKTLVLVGDSLAMTLANGVIKAGGEEGWDVTVIAGFNCPFTPNITLPNNECNKVSDKAMSYITKTSPTAVMIVNNYTSLDVALDNSRVIDELNSKGVNVIVADGSTKGDKYSGKQTIFSRKGEATRYREPIQFEPFVVSIYSSISEKHPSVSVWDEFCGELGCLTAKDGVEFYSDEDHLSPQGAEVLIPQIKKALSLST